MTANGRGAAIVGGNRIPFARSNGAYAQASNQDMLTAALDGLVARFGLAGERLGEVVGGAVLKHSRDFNLTRECVLGGALDHTTPAYDVQQAYDDGFFDDLLTPYLGLDRDEILRPDSSPEKLAKLSPVFGNGDGATMTAGNSTPLSDGAAAVLVASDEWAAEHSLP